MDPKGKGIVINDKEKESFVNEPKDDNSDDSTSKKKRLIKTIPLTILVFHTTPMLI